MGTKRSSIKFPGCGRTCATSSAASSLMHTSLCEKSEQTVVVFVAEVQSSCVVVCVVPGATASVCGVVECVDGRDTSFAQAVGGDFAHYGGLFASFVCEEPGSAFLDEHVCFDLEAKSSGFSSVQVFLAPLPTRRPSDAGLPCDRASREPRFPEDVCDLVRKG